MNQKKESYLSPRIEVIEVENEGVIAASGNGGVNGMDNTDWAPKTSTYSTRSAGNSDLEDMINDILTIEN